MSNVIRLGDYITEISEKTTVNNQHMVLTSSQEGIVSQDDYFNKQVASKDNTGYKIIRRGQFTYRAMSDTGRFYINRLTDYDIGIVSPAYPVFELRTNGQILPEYLQEYFHSEHFQNAITLSSTGSTRVSLKLAKIADLRIDIPTLPKQQCAVQAISHVNHLISMQNSSAAKLDQLVKSRFVEMFGDPENNPKHWDKVSLSNVISNANNGMARRGNDTEGSIVLRLVELQDGFIDYSSPNRIVLTEAEKKRYLLKNRDFLFARVNGNPENVGRCAEFSDIGEPVYHNDHIIRVHFDENVINGCFASALLNSAYGKRQMAGQIKTSAGQYTINQEGIGAIVTVLPPLELQNCFAAFVAEVDKSKLSYEMEVAA